MSPQRRSIKSSYCFVLQQEAHLGMFLKEDKFLRRISYTYKYDSSVSPSITVAQIDVVQVEDGCQVFVRMSHSISSRQCLPP